MWILPPIFIWAGKGEREPKFFISYWFNLLFFWLLLCQFNICLYFVVFLLTRMNEPVCQLPIITEDKMYEVDCPQKSLECCSEPGKSVPTFTLLTFHCKDGYKHNEGNVFVSSCSKGTWHPAISKCYSLYLYYIIP